MLGSFKDLIGSNSPRPIPQAMLDYFNEDLPKGYEYVLEKDSRSVCGLIPTGTNPLEIKGVKPILTERQEAIIGHDDPSAAEIEALISNALETVELDISDARLIGENLNLSADLLARTVDHNATTDSSRLIVNSTPIETAITFENSESQLEVHLVQKPSGDIHAIAFKSEGTALVISVMLYLDNRTSTYKFTFDNTKEQDAKRCLLAAITYDGLIEGTTLIWGKKHEMQPIEKRNTAHLAPFWKKVVEVQDNLGIALETNVPLNTTTIVNIERLHRSLCEGKAVELGYRPTSIESPVGNAPAIPKGQLCRLIIPEVKAIELFDVTIQVNGCIGLDGITIGEPKMDTGDMQIYPIGYTDESSCTILYLSPGKSDDSEENVAKLADVLFTDDISHAQS